jgi:raffinose/stachyose/melibiose transport system permease protein
MSSMTSGKKKSIIGAVFGWILSLMVIGPVYIIVINSFKTRGQIFSDQLGWPESFSFQFYADAAKQMNYLNSLKNSL